MVSFFLGAFPLGWDISFQFSSFCAISESNFCDWLYLARNALTYTPGHGSASHLFFLRQSPVSQGRPKLRIFLLPPCDC